MEMLEEFIIEIFPNFPAEILPEIHADIHTDITPGIPPAASLFNIVEISPGFCTEISVGFF